MDLTCLSCLSITALHLGVIAWFDRHWQSADVAPVDVRVARKWLMIAGGVLVAWIILSVVMLNSWADQPTVRVAALRPNFPLPAFHDEVNTSQIRFDVFAEQAREAASQGAQVLYTPEMMFNFDPQVEFTEQFRAVAKETGAYIFITYMVAISSSDLSCLTTQSAPTPRSAPAKARQQNPVALA